MGPAHIPKRGHRLRPPLTPDQDAESRSDFSVARTLPHKPSLLTFSNPAGCSSRNSLLFPQLLPLSRNPDLNGCEVSCNFCVSNVTKCKIDKMSCRELIFWVGGRHWRCCGCYIKSSRPRMTLFLRLKRRKLSQAGLGGSYL